MIFRKPRPYITNPDGRIPRDHVVQDPAWAVFTEQAARMDEAADILKAAMKAEIRAETTAGEIRTRFEDACLEALSALKPSAPAERELVEVPPAPQRYAAPVIPGGAS